MGFLSLQAINPPGTVFPFAGITSPSGYLLCDGSEVSRTTYNALFATIGDLYGAGDGSTTFNIPDFRFQFLRGSSGIQSSITGSGLVSTSPANQATFTNHGLTTGTLIKVIGNGISPGLSLLTDYYAIVVDSNTLAFATTYALALAGTRVTLTAGLTNNAVISRYNLFGISTAASAILNTMTIPNHPFNRSGMRVRFISGGTLPSNLATGVTYYTIYIDANTLAFATSYQNAVLNSRVDILTTTSTAALLQWEDPDISTRNLASTFGGIIGAGTRQEDQNLSHTHTVAVVGPTNAAASNARTEVGGGLVTSSPSGGFQANPINVYINYIIKT
jgi:microcystin-dependent protein